MLKLLDLTVIYFKCVSQSLNHCLAGSFTFLVQKSTKKELPMSGYHGRGGNYGGPTKRPRFDGDGGHHRSVVHSPPKRAHYSGNYTAPQTDYEEPNGPNRILLFTVFNPLFPIDCSVIFNVCSQVKLKLRYFFIVKKYFKRICR